MGQNYGTRKLLIKRTADFVPQRVGFGIARSLDARVFARRRDDARSSVESRADQSPRLKRDVALDRHYERLVRLIVVFARELQPLADRVT